MAEGDVAIGAFWRDNRVPSQATKEHLSPQVCGLIGQGARIVQMDGLLCRRLLRPDGGEETLHLLLPERVKEEILYQLHQNHGHRAWNGLPSSGVTGRGWPRISATGVNGVSAVYWQRTHSPGPVLVLATY